MRPIVLLTVVLLPSVVSAQAPAPGAAPAPAAPAWSIGAGLGGGSSVFGFVPIAGQFVSLPSVPAVSASLERRLSDRSWAVLGVSGIVSRQELDVPAGATGVTRSDYTVVGVSAGVRYVLTPARSPVDVSALALAEGGSLRWDVDALEPAPFTRKDTGWLVGASAGLALDRELTHRIALRLATPLVAIRYFSTETRVTGEPNVGGTQLFANVVIDPRLELRVAF